MPGYLEGLESKSEEHGAVIDALKIMRQKPVADKLFSLKRMRTRADYNLNYHHTPGEGRTAIVLADNVLQEVR